MPDGICPFATHNIVSQIRGISRGYIDRVGFCDHTAGGWFTTLSRASFWNDPNADGASGDALSVHFGISRKGEIVQITNIFDTAFAQGRLGPVVSWPYYDNPAKPYRKVNPNYLLVSTEHEDITAQGYVPGSQWTEEQYEADLRVKRWCVDEVKRVAGLDMLQYGIESLTGHHMFDAVNRAECPGRFWRNEYRERLLNDLSQSGDEDDMYHPHDAWATKGIWGAPGLAIPGGVTQDVNAEWDFLLPAEAKSIDIELMLAKGYVVIHHGIKAPDGHLMPAGRVGWGVPINAASIQNMRVSLERRSAGGLWFSMHAEDVSNAPVFLGAHVTGYYT